jgi:hypothetical protein
MPGVPAALGARHVHEMMTGIACVTPVTLLDAVSDDADGLVGAEVSPQPNVTSIVATAAQATAVTRFIMSSTSPGLASGFVLSTFLSAAQICAAVPGRLDRYWRASTRSRFGNGVVPDMGNG